MSVNPDEIPKKSRLIVNGPDVVNETIDGEVIMINLKSGNYYSTDSVGAQIWSWAEKQASLSEVIRALQARYEGEEARIEEATAEFVGKLLSENLVRLDGEGGECAALPPETFQRQEGERPSFQDPALEKYSDMQELLLLDPIHDVDDTGWPTKISGE